MQLLRSTFRPALILAVVGPLCAAQAPQTGDQTPPSAKKQAQQTSSTAQAFPAALVEGGNTLFQKECAFCHGRDAGGGESGPDLTRSKLVADDVNGDKIGSVVRNGRVEKGMPKFNVSDADVSALAAFVHTQKMKAEAQKGGRKGVDVADLQTGNLEEGKQYFEGAGGCKGCHSASGDLAGIASRLQGLQLEERMLYPKNVKGKVTVTPVSGQTVSGTLAYLDEFTVGVTDGSGQYHSYPVSKVKYKVDAPVEAHAELLGKYSDADIHNLMAYLQSLK